jgi:hypothetical protein
LIANLNFFLAGPRVSGGKHVETLPGVVNEVDI